MIARRPCRGILCGRGRNQRRVRRGASRRPAAIAFQNNFAKTVTFTGREIAKILGIQSVHGKFYQRLKVAMDM